MPAFMDNEPRRKGKKAANFKMFSEQRRQFDDTNLLNADQVATVKFAIQEGMAIRFGLTKDGGALCIAIYKDGDVKNAYVRDDDELNEFFAVLYEFCKGSVE